VLQSVPQQAVDHHQCKGRDYPIGSSTTTSYFLSR
jgi:hypothetical protein